MHRIAQRRRNAHRTAAAKQVINKPSDTKQDAHAYYMSTFRKISPVACKASEDPFLSSVTSQLSYTLYEHQALEFAVRHDDYRFVRAKQDIPAGQIILAENIMASPEHVLMTCLASNKQLFDEAFPRTLNSAWIQDKPNASQADLKVFIDAVISKTLGSVLNSPCENGQVLTYMFGERSKWFNSSMNFNCKLNNIVCTTPLVDGDVSKSLPCRDLLYMTLVSCKPIKAGEELLLYYPYFDMETDQLVRDDKVEQASMQSIFKDIKKEVYDRGMRRLMRAYGRNPMQAQVILNHNLAANGVVVDNDVVYSLMFTKEECHALVEGFKEEIRLTDRTKLLTAEDDGEDDE